MLFQLLWVAKEKIMKMFWQIVFDWNMEGGPLLILGMAVRLHQMLNDADNAGIFVNICINLHQGLSARRPPN